MKAPTDCFNRPRFFFFLSTKILSSNPVFTVDYTSILKRLNFYIHLRSIGRTTTYGTVRTLVGLVTRVSDTRPSHSSHLRNEVLRVLLTFRVGLKFVQTFPRSCPGDEPGVTLPG